MAWLPSLRNITHGSPDRIAAREIVQQADISRMERGILAPTTSTLMRLVEALDGRLVIELVRTDKKKPVGKALVPTVVSRTH